jgi:Raf kinase inhibitor-like YbhB/YbcL family protein
MFKIWSHDFQHEGSIPPMFTSDGPNINPHLAWDGVPEGTKSFALLIDDPATYKGGWTHWLITDIPANTHSIPQNSVPAGAVQVKNDFNQEGYTGPRPPTGVHEYVFKVYAMDRENLKAKNRRKFLKMVKKHSIAEAELVGFYSSR